MKFIIANILIFSCLAYGDEIFCHTEVGKKITLGNYQTTLSKLQNEEKNFILKLKRILPEKCTELEAKRVPKNEIVLQLYNLCIEEIKRKLIEIEETNNDEFNKVKIECDKSKVLADNYLENEKRKTTEAAIIHQPRSGGETSYTREKLLIERQNILDSSNEQSIQRQQRERLNQINKILNDDTIK